MNFPAVKEYVISYLQKALPNNLSYHGLHHTIGVYLDAHEIALSEGIGQHELQLLLTAALLHDAGFTRTYNEHEAASADIAREILPQFGYSTEQIERICEMIMATKIPQTPKDHLAQILCDADLYYLGGDEFYPIGHTLFQEFCDRGIVCDEEGWNKIQLNFLSKHEFFTKTAKERRGKNKERYLMEIQEIVSRYAA
ncbi:MAG: HD domain-containing protein [Bacteroidota bacterium]